MLHTEELSAKALCYPGLNYQSIEGTVLATIINAKVNDVESLKIQGTRTKEHVSFADALKQNAKRNFILECKQSSPTLGDFCKDFDLDKLIDCYEKRASAISVLCEKHFFKGSLQYLEYVKARTSLPVICKDFIICKEQIHEAYVAGADAVLLMLSVLDKAKFKELYDYAHSLDLDVLTEVDEKEDALFAVKENIKIVGINNRNLRTLKVDLNKAKELSTMFSKDVTVVSESGINTHQDLVSLKPINNFLIGSSITAQNDVVFKANSMLYGLNKLCGLTSLDAVDAAVKSHVSIGGLIFCKKSPRYINVEKAKEFTDKYQGQIRFCGVFVDENINTLVDIAKKAHLDYVQLHGLESVEDILEIKKRLPSIQIIKAINIKSDKYFSLVDEYLDVCDLIILDSSAPGSGTSFDWSMIPSNMDKSRILLSGGIGLDNVETALGYGFAGLDLNSKLEKIKGVKDVELIKDVFSIINNY